MAQLYKQGTKVESCGEIEYLTRFIIEIGRHGRVATCPAGFTTRANHTWIAWSGLDEAIMVPNEKFRLR